MNINDGIFIVGAERSGTTLLRMILDSHKDLSAGEETGFLPEMYYLIKNRWHQLQHYGITEEEVIEKIRTFYLEFQLKFLKSNQKKYWIDKTPAYINFIDELLIVFPEAKFVNIIRDGRDVAASHKEMFGKAGFLKIVWEWPNAIKLGFRAKDQINDRICFVKYEDLVNRPEKTIRVLLDFLEVDWDDAVMSHHKSKHTTHTGFAYDRPLGKITNKKIASWKTRLNLLERLLINVAFKPYLSELNYRKCKVRSIDRLGQKVTVKISWKIYKMLYNSR